MLQFMDNFQMYGSDESLFTNGVYVSAAGVSLVEDPSPTSTETVIFVSAGSLPFPGFLRRALSSPLGAVGMCARVWFDVLPNANTNELNRPFNILDSGGNGLASVRVDSSGRLCVYGTPNGGQLGATPGPVITANAWWHIEVFFVQGGDDNSSVEIRVEGLPVLTLEDISFANSSPIAQCGPFNYTNGSSSHTDYFYRDFVVWDTLGAQNNDFLGSVIVYSLIPTADVALNWTPSTGSVGYSILDNSPPNDAQFISAPFPAIPPAYVCELSDLPPDVTSVKGIASFVRAAKTDGGDGSLQVSVISDATPGNGANRPITVAQTWWMDIFETDPATSAAWLPSAVDAAQLQLNRTA